MTLAAEGLDDAVAGEGLGGEMRQMLELFLAAARRSPDALPETNERIHDERRAGKGKQRQLPVVEEHQRREADDGEAFAQQVPHRLRNGLLHLPDVGFAALMFFYDWKLSL